MNPSLTQLTKFKHDTIGKFQSIKELIESIDEDNISDSDSQEILIEIRDVFKKMSIATELLIKK